MASAQVLRKQEHLEAGRKKLEEFRRKKAAEKAKKATSTSQHDVSSGVLNAKQPSETEFIWPTDFSGVGISNVVDAGGLELSTVITKNETTESDTVQKSGLTSSSDRLAHSSLLSNNNDFNSSVLAQSHLIGSEFKGESSHQSSDDGDQQPNPSEDHNKALSLGYFGISVAPETNVLPENSVSTFLQDKSRYDDRMASSMTSSSYLDSVHSTTDDRNSTSGLGQKFPIMGQDKPSGSVIHGGSTNNAPWVESRGHADFSSDTQSSSNHALQSTPATGRRSRPSFLDSINISRGPSASPSLFGSSKTDSSTSKVYPEDSLASPFPQSTGNSATASGNGGDFFNHVMENSMENKHDYYARKQNDDFSALEQHIEDLTQEKFALQRALEASRTLAESLAAENSTLTENYNQQGGIVNQLKFDLEKLQAEIKAQLTELEAVKIEYANVQLECNAADERAKLLASEVIGLEEKALRLRSNELKLERQLEDSQAEISSYRKKMSSLEKDRQELQSTIDALQEEKKLLQSKLRKASASGKSLDIKKSSSNAKDASTSTEDLGHDRDGGANIEASENLGATSLGEDGPSSQFPHENIPVSIDGLSLSIPSDQMRTIQNINTLIAELTLEKDQMTQALLAESSENSKLMEFNKELTRKLEAQTQRLELLTARSMANDIIPARQSDPRSPLDETPYADEGDEVVERVLGWIMKLFPGGPSKRRTSKLL